MPLDLENSRLMLGRLGDEIEEAAQNAAKPLGPLRDPLRVERDAQKVTLIRFFRVEVRVNGERDRIDAVLVTGEDRRPEVRDYPLPRDKTEFRALAVELIEPLMFRGRHP